MLWLLWNAFLIAFSALLPLINPLGSALVFLGLVGDAPPEVFRALARKIALKRDELQLTQDMPLGGLEQKAFYPFTFPVTAGPGTLVVMLTLSARFSGGTAMNNALGHLGLFLAVLLLSGLVYLCYAHASRITRSIAPATAHGILRVVAFILLCIGVQIAWNGLSVLLPPLLHRG